MCCINQQCHYSVVSAKKGLWEYTEGNLNPALGFPMVHKRMSTFTYNKVRNVEISIKHSLPAP